MSLLNALRGINGDYEVQRVLGAFGTLTYIVTPPALIWAGKVQVTIAEFCVAYPAGLAACITATAGAIAIKDRQVAKAKAESPEIPA